MTYWLLRIVRKVAQILPLRVCYAAAVLLSELAWLIMPVQRENAINNMAQVLGCDSKDPVARRKAKTSFRYYAYYMADFLRLPVTDPDEIDARFQFDAWKDIDRALEGGKGVVFISAHVGNWDAACSALSRRGYPLNVVVDTFHPKRLNDLVQGHRCSHGTKVIQLEDSARRVLGALRKNEILGLLIDIPSPENGVMVKFFGKQTYVPAGGALLSLKTGANLISGIIVRNPDHTYKGMVTSQFDVELTGDLSVDVKLLTQRIMDSMENFIRQYPEQWFIFRPMWPDEFPIKA
jgi:lauroyl/myristoyl acyltransferase